MTRKLNMGVEWKIPRLSTVQQFIRQSQRPSRSCLLLLGVWATLVILFVGGLFSALNLFLITPLQSTYDVEKYLDADFNPKASIPKILHQTWKTDVIPEKWSVPTTSCRSLNKEYTYMLWSHAKIEAFVKEHYPWFTSQFYFYNYWIQRCNIFRYLILYHYGGVYIDLDIQCKYNFSHVLKDMNESQSVLVPRTWPVGFTNQFLAAKPHHPFFKHVLARLKDGHVNYPVFYFYIMATSGTMYVSRCLTTYSHQDQVHMMTVRDLKHTYFRHHFGGSWQHWDQWIINFWPSWVLASLLLLFVLRLLGRACSRGSHNGRNEWVRYQT